MDKIKTTMIFIPNLHLEDCLSLLAALDVTVSIGGDLQQIYYISVSFRVIYEGTKGVI